MVYCLEIAPKSYKPLSEEDKKEEYFLAKCDKCGWYGSSKLTLGGDQIADTGDYDNIYCPICGSSDIDEI